MKALAPLLSLWLLLSLLLSSTRARPAPADDPNDPDATACPGGAMPDNYMQIAEAKNHFEVPPQPICPQAGQPGVGPPSQWQSQGSSKPANSPKYANATDSAASSTGTAGTAPPAAASPSAPPSEPSVISTLQPDDQGQIHIPHKCYTYTPVDPYHGNLNAPGPEGWETMCHEACAPFVDDAKKAGTIDPTADPPATCFSNGKWPWDEKGTIYKVMYGYKVAWGDCTCMDVAADAVMSMVGQIIVETLPKIVEIGEQLMLSAFELVLSAPLNLIPGVGEAAEGAVVAAIGAAKLCDWAYDAATGFKAFYNWSKNVKNWSGDAKSLYNQAKSNTAKPWKPPEGVKQGSGKFGDKGAPKDWDKNPPGKGDDKAPGKPDDNPPGKPDDKPPDNGKPDNGKPDKDKPDKSKPKKCKKKGGKGGKAGKPLKMKT